MPVVVPCPLGQHCLTGRENHVAGSQAYKDCVEGVTGRLVQSTADNLSELRSDMSSSQDTDKVHVEDSSDDTLACEIDLSGHTRNNRFLYDEYIGMHIHTADRTYLYREGDNVICQQEWDFPLSVTDVGDMYLYKAHEAPGFLNPDSDLYEMVTKLTGRMLLDDASHWIQAKSGNHRSHITDDDNGNVMLSLSVSESAHPDESFINDNNENASVGEMMEKLRSVYRVTSDIHESVIRSDAQKKNNYVDTTLAEVGVLDVVDTAKGLESSHYAHYREMEARDLDDAWRFVQMKKEHSHMTPRAIVSSIVWIGDEDEAEQFTQDDGINSMKVDDVYVAWNMIELDEMRQWKEWLQE